MKFGILSLAFVGLFVWSQDVYGQKDDLVPPITDYSRGQPKDRVEYVVAEVHPDNLDQGTTPNDATRAYSKDMSPYKNDDAGHVIAARLGGTGRDTYNIVPHNRAYNRGAWRTQVEAPIYDKVKEGNDIKYEVWPEYDNDQATRPNALRYKATLSDGSVFMEGKMDNPPPDE